MPWPEELSGFERTLGLSFTDLTPDRVVLNCPVREELRQPYGIVHGGVYCSLVETAGSVAAALWFGDRGHVVGVANHTDFLRAVRDGVLTAVATPIHRGRTQQLWLVEITGADDKLVARGELRLANVTDAAVLGG